MCTRVITHTTDDPEVAFVILKEKRATGQDGWDMAEVRTMSDPPKTKHKWCVFRVITKG